MAIGSAVVGGILNYSSARAANAAKKRAIAIQRNNAVRSYTSTTASVNLMKNNSRESALNAVSEVLRAGAENTREGKKALTRAKGSLQSRSEGLTSGNTSGRAMAEVYSKGSKMLHKLNSNTTTMISQITDKMDSNTNSLNNKQIEAYNKMTSVLQQEHPAAANTTGALLSGAMKGYQIGTSLSNSFEGIQASLNKPAPKIPKDMQMNTPTQVDTGYNF